MRLAAIRCIALRYSRCGSVRCGDELGFTADEAAASKIALVTEAIYDKFVMQRVRIWHVSITCQGECIPIHTMSSLHSQMQT